MCCFHRPTLAVFSRFLEGAQTLQVAVTTLPQLFADLSLTGHISLLKIDVSGACGGGLSGCKFKLL